MGAREQRKEIQSQNTTHPSPPTPQAWHVQQSALKISLPVETVLQT